MKFLFVNVGKTQYGGKVYENMVKNVLSYYYKVESLNIRQISQVLWNLWSVSKWKNYDIVIKDFDSCIFLNKKPVKTIAIIHHLDNSFSPFLIKFAYLFSTYFILRNLRKVAAIVVVSKYWEDYFKRRNYKNVYLIYNGFNLNDFNFSVQEIRDFKMRYGLTKKPIIYLGNCQRGKGVVDSYQVLKDLDAYLVTSGKQKVKIPARNFQFGYREYLKLLKASSVVLAMSKFKEGWCRTAHEAMLLKTPVIGSGEGGMRELLEGGGQIICENFNDLKEKVIYLLSNPQEREKIGEKGFNFAKQFTLEKFSKHWIELIEMLSNRCNYE